MDGHRVVRIEDILSKVDIVVAATGNKHIITRERESDLAQNVEMDSDKWVFQLLWVAKLEK